MASEIDLFREAMLTKEDVEFGTPATEAEVADFEARYNTRLPADIREYFLKINGVYEHGGFITIEALKDWCLLFEYKYNSPTYFRGILPDADKYFRFGCYDILVWQWLITLDINPHVETPIIVIYEKVTTIANSFSDFLRLSRTQSPEDLAFA